MYLYGASVQGIQKFIFRTNKLKSIAGASELVAQICTKEFTDLLGRTNEGDWLKEHRVVSAAGNIKYILDEADCRKAVKEFPKRIMTLAPGITISQAVVGYNEDEDFSSLIDQLEAKLKAQRNRPSAPLFVGQLGMVRSPQTGEPMIYESGAWRAPSEFAKENASDTLGLCRKSFGIPVVSRQLAHDVSSLTYKNDWIAIVHVDGNSMGQVVQRIGSDRERFTSFSATLDEVTELAANDAFDAIKGSLEDSEVIPIRPVVLGGDDMTVIIRAELAIDYTKAYMEAFERHSRIKLGHLLAGVFDGGEDYLTSCGGIAFIKSSYPFYYGYNLAEQLCSAAKTAARQKRSSANAVIGSCLMFHKVQDSFVREYEDIERRELTINGGKGIFKYGPYYLGNGEPSIDRLIECAETLGEEQSAGVRSGLREYLTLLHEDYSKAQQRLDRLKYTNKSSIVLIEELTTKSCYNAIMAYDCLAIYTVLNQITKEVNK